MSYFEVFLLAIGLSMDSLAVSISYGGTLNPTAMSKLVRTGWVMGCFQSGMLLLGVIAGKTFEPLIKSIDHWLAFGLLLYLGGRMIFEGIAPGKEKSEVHYSLPSLKFEAGLAFATSIDAIMVGITLGIVASFNMFYAAGIVFLVTFILAFFGVYFGNKTSRKLKINFILLGGIVLVLLGGKILIEHLLYD